MSRKKTVAVLFGGISVEHEVSLVSSRFVIENLDSSRFDVLPVFISKEGRWRRVSIDDRTGGEPRPPVPDSEIVPMLSCGSPGRFAEIAGERLGEVISVDVIFPVLHGTFGEDGTVQGLADLMGVPCVGADVLGSSLCMDKTVSKMILRQSGVPVVDFLGFERAEWERDSARVLSDVEDAVGFPCFVKSANLGSSVGVSRVDSRKDFAGAVRSALGFSERVVAERAVPGPREIEVSVIGNRDPRASVPGELLLGGNFYDYDTKYRTGFCEFAIPCELDRETRRRIEDLALASYSALRCSGMARVDFLVDGNTGSVFVSEINTIPGFTPASMYPKLWEASGLGVGEMLETLISLAEEEHRTKSRLRTDFSE